MKPRRAKIKTRRIVVPDVASEPVVDLSLKGSFSGQIQELIDLLRRNNLTELEFERHGTRIRVRHELSVKPTITSPLDSTPASSQQSTHLSSTTMPVLEGATGFVTVTSPIVGTFYQSPSPDADAYVEEGDVVKKGQVLCIVEAMKLMNEIESEVDGRIVKILVENMKSVEYGQALFLIDPKATS